MGDLTGNAAKIHNALATASKNNPDLAVFSELCVQGYPPNDLLEQQWFVEDSLGVLDRIIAFSKEFAPAALLLGCALPSQIKGTKLGRAYRRRKNRLPAG